jgi:xanthine dehydrogenase YagT iron-sulfur-binding subunit
VERPGRKKNFVSRRDFLKSVGGGAAGLGAVPRALGRPGARPPDALETADRHRIALTINGRKIKLDVESRDTLLDVLRERLRFTGAKRVCNRGECGGCTVLLDGRPVYSCHLLAVQADGREIRTVESLAVKGALHPLQKAFIEKDGYQCGYCTPGFLMVSAALLEKTKAPTAEEIRTALSGNLCRCGNYQKIHAAVSAAAEEMRRG